MTGARPRQTVAPIPSRGTHRVRGEVEVHDRPRHAHVAEAPRAAGGAALADVGRHVEDEARRDEPRGLVEGGVLLVHGGASGGRELHEAPGGVDALKHAEYQGSKSSAARDAGRCREIGVLWLPA